MGLMEYARKRDFKKTKEPKASKKNSKGKLAYLIHRHDARNLHYDLRLELKGVLKSWAVPKGPPKGKEKRLAVQTEDHPYCYKDFEGVIEEGNYGAGKVEIWDSGTYDLLDMTKDKYLVDIKGKKLNGKYVLIKLKKDDKKDKNWLFFK